MAVAHTGMDILFHDSFYVVGHFHVMLAGAAMFGSFGAFYFYFPAIFGVKFSRIYGYLHCIYIYSKLARLALPSTEELRLATNLPERGPRGLGRSETGR